MRAQFQNVVEGGESLDRRVEFLGKYPTRVLSLALFMVPANIAVGYWEIQRAGIDLWLPWIFLVLFDFILLSYAIGVARLTFEGIRNGSARMRFRDKTVRRGGTLEAAFYGGPRFEDRTTIHAYLRCVEERFVRSGRTDQHLACFERFKSEKQDTRANTEGVTTFRFDVPADAPGRHLTRLPPPAREGGRPVPPRERAAARRVRVGRSQARRVLGVMARLV